MGLFDRKRPEEEPAAPAPQPAPAPKAAAPAKEAEPKKAAEPAKAEPKPSKAVEPAKPAYGIQNAIELMRQLPSDNVQLVVEVVKKTLESLNVNIGSIITDAEHKHARIDNRVSTLRAEIADYEEEIAARKDEIDALTADRDETKLVKERLEMAQQPSSVSTGKMSPAASVPAPGESSRESHSVSGSMSGSNG